MKMWGVLICLFGCHVALASSNMTMSFKDEEISKVIESYSKATNQKFVVSPNVRGKASLYVPQAVSQEEAFNLLSTALAAEGFALSKREDTYLVGSARNIQRDFIEVSSEVPPLKPQRMFTWIYTVKNVPALSLNRDLRILTSKDGELAINVNTNQVILTDWVSNIHRVAQIFKEIDKKPEASVAKLVSESLALARASREQERFNKGQTKTDEKKSSSENN